MLSQLVSDHDLSYFQYLPELRIQIPEPGLWERKHHTCGLGLGSGIPVVSPVCSHQIHVYKTRARILILWFFGAVFRRKIVWPVSGSVQVATAVHN